MIYPTLKKIKSKTAPATSLPMRLNCENGVKPCRVIIKQMTRGPIYPKLSKILRYRRNLISYTNRKAIVTTRLKATQLMVIHHYT